MCTAVVDVQVNMRVVELEEDVTKYDSHVQVTMEVGTVWACRGGSNIQHLGFVSAESGNCYHQSFLQHLPLQFKELNLSNFYVEKSLKELR